MVDLAVFNDGQPNQLLVNCDIPLINIGGFCRAGFDLKLNDKALIPAEGSTDGSKNMLLLQGQTLMPNNVWFPPPKEASVTVGGKPCRIQVLDSKTWLILATADGVGTDKAVQVSSLGTTVTAGVVFSYSSPTISTLTPTHIKRSELGSAAVAELTGLNFGASASVRTVTVCGVSCAENSLTIDPHTGLKCSFPSSVFDDLAPCQV